MQQTTIHARLIAAVDKHSITESRKTLTTLNVESPELADHLGELARQFDMAAIKSVISEIKQNSV